MVIEIVTTGLLEKEPILQDETEARYLPQRKPEDGAIDWQRSPAEIDRFIRALTRPYPGAFSKFQNGILKIFKASVLHSTFKVTNSPGTILHKTGTSKLVVEAGNGLLHIEDYVFTGVTSPQEGDKLESVNFEKQMRNIVQRHQKKYPNLPIQEEILKLARLS